MEKTNKIFAIHTLGCRTNQYESQAISQQLEALGWRVAKDSDLASLVIINTCTVTHQADASSRHSIRHLAEKHQSSRVIVTGCFAKREQELIHKMGYQVIEQKETLVKSLFPEEDVPSYQLQHVTMQTRAFLKVQDGCNEYCSYCIIPQVRGRSRSRSIQDIVHEGGTILRSGTRELVLTGINIGDFDGNDGKSLADLVLSLDALPLLKRLRISSINPNDITDSLYEVLSKSQSFCPWFHLALQSGSDTILKKMRRPYTKSLIYDLAKKLEKTFPRITFSADFIIGFPEEQEEDFQETLTMIETLPFSKVHIFPYSERPKTLAEHLKKVPNEIIRERMDRALRTADEIHEKTYRRFQGSFATILTEKGKTEDTLEGHTDNFLHVTIPKGSHLPNEFVDVCLKEKTPLGFKGTYET